MVKITYVSSKGEEQIVSASSGRSLMETAIANGVREIDADCGGNCYCGTCRIYVVEEWRDRLPPPDEFETGMVESTEDGRPGVRLSCQIRITEQMDGIVVHTPSSQR